MGKCLEILPCVPVFELGNFQRYYLVFRYVSGEMSADTNYHRMPVHIKAGLVDCSTLSYARQIVCLRPLQQLIVPVYRRLLGRSLCVLNVYCVQGKSSTELECEQRRHKVTNGVWNVLP